MRTIALLLALLTLPALARAEEPTKPTPPLAKADRLPRGSGLYIAGLSLFAASYVPTSAYGIYDVASTGKVGISAVAQLPVGGPFAIAGILLDLDGRDAQSQGLAALFIIDGIAQAAGLALTLAGAMIRSDVRASKVAVLPTGNGLAVSGRF